MQVSFVELVGEGALKRVYDELKKKLESEGLFAESRKREIPVYPHRIGVITSKSGAVIHDFLSNLDKFGYQVLFIDSKVEGADAIQDLLKSVQTLESKELDVLVMMRGGGSLESFQAFNNELLVRAVARFPVPVITGIGHDKDAPLVSMVSDMNVSTPTAVAHALNASWNEALSKVRLSEEKIFVPFQSRLKDVHFSIENGEVTIQNRFTELLSVFTQAEETVKHSLSRIDSGITRIKETISQKSKELSRGFSLVFSQVAETIKQSEKVIDMSSPIRQLSRGYSIVKSDGRILRSIKHIKKGDRLDIMVSDGRIESQII
jgi:exodeoxyribonuclease VII large subunit